MTVLRGAGPSDDDGFGATWLDLRAPADDRARSVELLDRLAARLPEHPHLMDVGCGTGAMQRWCASRLRVVHRWTLLDPDETLLGEAVGRAPGGTGTLLGGVADLCPVDLAGIDAVVCSALLDVLPEAQLDHLVQVVADADVPLLAALTVTGQVRLSPSHPDDAAARLAVDRTATAGGGSGPAALEMLRAAAHRRGATVAGRGTPWRLGPASDPGLLGAWADGYLAAVLAGDPTLTGWVGARREDLDAGRLTAEVGHVDVLVEPG